jgi:prolyl oligopeptidase
VTFTDVIGGVTVEDPFRWLEDDTDPAVQAWQDEQDERTTKELAASPRAAQVRAAADATFEDVFGYNAPQRFGATWFHLATPAGRTTPVLAVGEAPGACDRVLVDPAEQGPDVTVIAWQPSPDGAFVVVGTGAGGPIGVRVLEVSTGRVALELPERMGTYFFAWAADNSGFFHQAFGMTVDAGGNPVPETEVWWQPLDGEAVRQQLELDHPMAWPVVSADGRWVAVMADQTGPRPRWVRAPDGEWQRFLPTANGMYKGSFVGDEYWAITDDTSGWCRLVAIPVATNDDASTWRELVPAVPGTKLSAVTPCGSRVALAVVRDGVMQLEVLELDGRRAGQVALPGDGAFGKSGVGHLMSILGDVVIADGDGCVFVHSTFDRAPGVYRADLTTLQVEVLVAPRHVQTDRLVDVRRTAGPRGVVYRVVRKEGTPLDGSAPVIVTGYGGFNVPWLPFYSAMAAAWTELGGVWVHTHLRGGGEQDKEFWHAGRMHRKQGTFDDLFEVLEELHARGEAVPERTGGWGSSNGGLLMGALVTQRPELVRAAVLQVPILDVLQCRKDPGTIGIAMADYGNPDDPADAPALHAYSPYHRVEQGTSYPAVLLDAGATDPSCPAWHSRKTAARLQEASTSGRRVLLRVREGSGHNQMTVDKWVQRDVEELTFLADELGLQG